MLTSAMTTFHRFLLSNLMRFNQNYRRKQKIDYCPKNIFLSPGLTLSQGQHLLLSISKHSSQYLDLLHVSCLCFSLKYVT